MIENNLRPNKITTTVPTQLRCIGMREGDDESLPGWLLGRRLNFDGKLNVVISRSSAHTQTVSCGNKTVDTLQIWRMQYNKLATGSRSLLQERGNKRASSNDANPQ